MKKSKEKEMTTNQVVTHKNFFNAPNVQKSFDDVWKGAGVQFATSILSVIQGNASLKSASNESIMTSAMKAAVLNLPIEPSLGRAYLVPYKGQVQFQLGYKGLIELAQRSGKYKSINAGPVYKSQFVSYDPLFEELTLDFTQPQDEVIGYFASFSLLNGFRKLTYWTKAEVEAHGKKFSKTFGNGPWKTDFDAMARKTVLKHILSIYGPLSVEMQTGMQNDESENDNATRDIKTAEPVNADQQLLEDLMNVDTETGEILEEVSELKDNGELDLKYEDPNAR
ncbi:TPA: recombinase RecT [Streptococcus suis]|nr:recombinase RecT [Streptococcus suis]HEM3209182.1 recombinase RecT [Streptococcus suis 22083]